MTQIRSYSSALMGLLLWSTSPHAERSPFDQALFLDCTEPTYIAQLLKGDTPPAAQIEQAAVGSMAPVEQTASITETAGQLDFEIPHWIVLQDHEGDDLVS
jgi:hypothetical protein